MVFGGRLAQRRHLAGHLLDGGRRDIFIEMVRVFHIEYVFTMSKPKIATFRQKSGLSREINRKGFRFRAIYANSSRHLRMSAVLSRTSSSEITSGGDMRNAVSQ